MNTIKILKRAAAISAGLMILGVSANADGIKFYESIMRNGDYSFVVEGYVPSGLAGEDINIMIFNPGYGIEDNKNNYTGEYLQHQTAAISEKDGYFKVEVPLYLDDVNDSGEYVCYVGGSGFSGAKKLEPCYFASITDRESAVQNIIGSSSSDILKNLEVAERDLALEDEIYKAVDKEKLALLVLNNKALLDSEKPAESAKVIRSLALLEAYNEGKKELAVSGTEFINTGIIDFSSVDKNGADFYSKGYKEMSEEGREKVIESLMNKGYKSVEELLDAFKESVVIHGIKYPVTSGTGHIDELLTKENASELKISIPKYLAIVSDTVRSKANTTIKNGTFKDKKELQAVVEAAAQSAGESKNQGSGGGGGGSASASGGSAQIIIGDNKVDLNQDIVDNEALNKEIFNDLADALWAKEAILSLYEKGIVSGVGDNLFAPGNNVTREQFIVMVMRAFDIEANVTESEFSDVLSGTYYKNYVASAASAGIVNGISENVFGVGKNITRQDLAVMVKNAAEFKGITLTGDKAIAFGDGEEISGYAKEAVESLVKAGVINGFSDGTFRPQKSCTRAEAAKIIYELVKGADI